MDELCLFCNMPEKGYTPSRHVEYICGLCVISLADATQADLKLAYIKATELQAEGKMRALESFIQEESIGQSKPKSKVHRRHTYRERSSKSIGNKKERIGRVSV